MWIYTVYGYGTRVAQHRVQVAHLSIICRIPLRVSISVSLYMWPHIFVTLEDGAGLISSRFLLFCALLMAACPSDFINRTFSLVSFPAIFLWLDTTSLLE